MTARQQAIEAAARAMYQGLVPWEDCSSSYRDQMRVLAANAAGALVPVLLNDLADRIEHQRFTAISHPYDTGYNAAVDDMLGFVRAAAEGWTE
jgi:hypothetical protein